MSPGLFMCTMDGSVQTCASTEVFELQRGAHTLTVAAFDAVTRAQDPTPATFTFKLKKKARH